MVEPREAGNIAYLSAKQAFAQLSKSGEVPDLGGPGTRKLEAWFLGPKAENAGELEALVVEALRDHVYWRRNFHPEDASHISEQIKRSDDFLVAQDCLRDNFWQLLAALKKSVPFFSMRYQGHMNWDVTLPGIVGYFAAMLYNPNNVAFEGSTATTILEMRVANDICKMLGYKIPSQQQSGPGAPTPWGHLTCDGTVANIEALWAARNVKFYPLALKAALEKSSAIDKSRRLAALKIPIKLCNGRSKPLKALKTWELLNITCDEALGLPQRLETDFKISIADLTAATNEFTVQDMGVYEFRQEFLPDVLAPVVLVSGTKHYSFPKAAALLGLGASNLIDVPVDLDARMDIEKLEGLLTGYSRRRQPVLAVISVIGTTEESAVDPLNEVLALREKFRSKGLDFIVHADGAWGGYHVCTVREDAEVGPEVPQLRAARKVDQPPRAPLSAHVQKQLRALGNADSITVDPHKSGYIPYPAGALCYRNGALRNLVSFSAPVVFHGVAEPTVGIFGIEGSKPGAAAASVFLSHSVIRPSKSGHGYIIEQAMFSCKKLYCKLLTMAADKDPFKCVPVPRLPSERDNMPSTVADLRRISGEILNKTNEAIGGDPAALKFLGELGPDQNILAYAFNFRLHDGTWNKDLDKANDFNSHLYTHLSIKPGRDIYDRTLIVSTTDFAQENYGAAFIDDFKQRLGVGESPGTKVTVLRSVVMDPWVTETAHGSFLEVIEAEFRKAIDDVLPLVRGS